MSHRHVPSLIILLLTMLISQTIYAKNRNAKVAGQFYPGNAKIIKQQLQTYFTEPTSNVSLDKNSDLIGIIVPHAGWIYSGKTAAIGFGAIKELDFKQAVFLGVDHRSRLPTLSVWPSGSYITPLAATRVDKKLADSFLSFSGLFAAEPLQHQNEHSIEVLLPFYQFLFPNKPAVFISCGGPPENGLKLAKAMQSILKNLPGKTLLVISSDWSHYHSAKKAEELDMRAINSVINLDSARLLQDCKQNKAELCGLNGVIAAIELFNQASATTKLLQRTDSSEVSGDKSNVVGYAAILMQGSKQALKAGKDKAQEDLSMTFQQRALQVVRETLEHHLNGKPVPEFKFSEKKFAEKSGIFVTLKQDENLRGCIGFIQGFAPLSEAIPEMAISAATRDPRFKPVTSDELPNIKIEISVLSPLEKVKDISEIEIGRHGLLLQLAGRSGLLLPQVPVEWNWDREEFLTNLCIKAGLPPGSHEHPNAILQKFSAEVFAEE